MENDKSGLTRRERRLINRANKEKFLKIFRFFLKSYNADLLTFNGSVPVKIVFDKKALDAKICFTAYNNGEYSDTELTEGIKTIHPNVLKAVIEGKKGWGLWLQQWTDGIASFDFEEIEILGMFIKRNIEIPDQLLLDFRKTWRKKRDDLYTNKNFPFLNFN